MSPNQYFSRAATWNIMDKHLVVHDSFSPNAPRMITMEPWHEVVFSAADGQHTIEQFVQHMGQQYPQGMPKGLREQICQIIDELIGEGILRLHNEPKELPRYFAEDSFSVPPDILKAQMQADGLISPRPK
jgi:hypothetical protein